MSEFASVESVVDALYRSVSFAPTVGPDYTLLRSLFHGQGRIVQPREDTDGIVCGMNVDEFFTHFDARLRVAGVTASGGSEIELSRKALVFKRIGHVFSTYKFVLPGSDEAIAQGVNTIELIHDQNRWWILSLAWDRAPLSEQITIESS
jgi:hypothetical protein